MDGFHHTDAFAATTANTGKVYIWLTRYGVLFFSVLLVMLLGALNYKNSMSLLLTFLLVGIALLSLFSTHRALAGLSLTRITCTAAFAGEPMMVSVDAVSLSVPAPSFQFTINGAVGRGALDAISRDTFYLSLPTVTRGIVALDRVRLETVYPLGLFRSWRTFHFDGARGVVYPAPRPGPLPIGHGNAEGASGPSQSIPGGQDFGGHRSYQPGDPPRHIDWRVYSRGQGLLTKTFATPASSVVNLVWNRLPEGDPEYRLSVMCHSVLKAAKERWRFDMQLPWASVPPGTGSRHVHACLHQLALMGGGGAP